MRRAYSWPSSCSAGQVPTPEPAAPPKAPKPPKIPKDPKPPKGKQPRKDDDDGLDRVE